MAGLLDFEDPRTMGLLNAGLGIMAQAGDTSRQFGLGQALASGLNTYQQTQLQAEMLKRKKAQDDMAMQINQMKFAEMQQEVAKQKAMEDAMVNYAKFKQSGSMPAKQQAAQVEAPSSVRGFSMPTAQSQNDRVNGNYTPQQLPMQAAPPQAPQAPQQQGFSKGGLVKQQISELMKQVEFYGSRPDYQSQQLAQQAQAQAIKLANELPKYALDYKEGYDSNGNLVNVRVADDGSEIYSPTKVATKLHFGDNGQQLLGIDQYTGKSKVISQKYQTPDSLSSAFVNMRGQDMVNARSKEANYIAANNKIVDLSTSLRKEFEGLPEVKDYKAAVPAYKSVVDAAKRNTPQADINLVYGIAKMYDPTSVVREGEYATIVNSANIPDKIKGYAQYLAGGGKFTPEVKAALVKEAEGRMNSFDEQYQKARADFETISQSSGAKPSLLFPKPYQPTVPNFTPSSGAWGIKKVN